ncbi:MAG: RIP metalloprotease RseP [Lachnospiraceae bacterium]|nr:RIP metalloprotease RseP [Lachnospiraceae bacterium]
MSFTTILWFIFVFCVIVVSHEFGHFIIAKINGIHVIEFTVGMGPKIWGFHKNGTYYVLRCLPLGGACIFDGMTDEDILDNVKKSDKKSLKDKADLTAFDAENGDNDAIDASALEAVDTVGPEKNYGKKFKDAPVWARISTVLAGPMFNFILSFLLAIVIVWFCGSDEPIVHELMEGYPAAEAGLMDGDRIVEIDGSNILTAREIYISTFINKDGKPMTVTYERDGERYTTTLVPKYDEESGRYLLGLMNYGEYVECNNAGVFKYAFREVRYGLVATFKSLGMLITGNGSKDDIAGPVGMAQIIGDVEKQAKPYGIGTVLLNMINIAMLLSVNLGIMNLLPIPALDGGRLIFLVIEAVRGKPVPAEKEGLVTLVGFIFLFGLMVFVMFNDIMRLVSR